MDVVRVGFYSSAGAAAVGPAGGLAAPTPRTLLPAIPEDCQLEDNNLRRISNVLVRVRLLVSPLTTGACAQGPS